MFKIQPYKLLTQAIEDEAFEPMLTWGLRMAIAASVPVIWGIATNNWAAATWIALTAECICWVELKGTFAQRLRVLLGGTFLALFFAILGSITGINIWLSIVFMLAVAFISSLFKNLGDRGSGLSICVYLLFIICNAYPTNTLPEVGERAWLVFIGAGWTIFVSLLISAFMPAQQPYRRSIALIWKSIAELVTIISKGWDGSGPRSAMRAVYLKEKDIRTAIDASIVFHEGMAHQVSEKDKHEYELAQLRKATSLVGAHIIAISDELEAINIQGIDNSLRLKLSALFKALQQAASRMAVMVLTLKPEEQLLLSSRLSRLNKLIVLLKENSADAGDYAAAVQRIILLSERSLRLFERSMDHLRAMGSDLPVFRSYSLYKTLFTLHPRHWIQNLRLLFNFNSFTTRYALRAAIAATVAMFIYKWFNIDHGYWLPFSVIIVMQPYFGATFKKAVQRIVGTVAGGLVGGALLHVHGTGMHIKEILLCLSFIFMVYYLRRNYGIAAFIITLNLVLLFNMEAPVTNELLVTRALSTIGGALLAVVAGFALLPHWDRKWLPMHLTDAINYNYEYFLTTFFPIVNSGTWTRNKRIAESKNSNAFDSFNRYIQEPGSKKAYSVYYQLITHNVRITRELNNVHLEEEGGDANNVGTATFIQQQLIYKCLSLFNQNIGLLSNFNPKVQVKMLQNDEQYRTPFGLTPRQLLYLDKLVIELQSMYTDLGKLLEMNGKD